MNTLVDVAETNELAMVEWRMIRNTCAKVLFILGVVCLANFVASVWIASFQDLLQQAYVHRTNGFLFCSVACFGACGLLLARGALLWIAKQFSIAMSCS